MEGEGHSLLHLEEEKSVGRTIVLSPSFSKVGRLGKRPNEGPAGPPARGKAVKGEDGRHYCCAKTVARYKR